ncbi:hypothetical protein PIROE2DRAFT_2932 [Piromyces sp. E2]|nr:hypothetical protein PIROE2DRAFT_2932 [Piromyces sp. E2]|eukprot:OUM69226.1 hypothetical protein PIROE2DRAFT_2932 [Piromyces sp. E2]
MDKISHITFFEDIKKVSYVVPIKNIDIFQKSIVNYITSDFFTFLCVYLVVNNKSWKRPVSICLITHWFLKSLGGSLESLTYRIPHDPNNYYPYSSINWFLYSFSESLYTIGSIIGDWYLLMRTKTLVNKRGSVMIIYITYFLQITIKLVIIASHFIFIPIDLRQKNENGDTVWDYINIMMLKTLLIAISFVTTFIYGLFVIIVLKKNLLHNNYNIVKNSIINKVKKYSEYRIYISMIVTMVLIPLYFMQNYTFGVYIKDKNIPNFDMLYNFIRHFNCYIMYIDQILNMYYYNKEENYRNTLNSSILSSIDISEINKSTSKSYLFNLLKMNNKTTTTTTSLNNSNSKTKYDSFNIHDYTSSSSTVSARSSIDQTMTDTKAADSVNLLKSPKETHNDEENEKK